MNVFLLKVWPPPDKLYDMDDITIIGFATRKLAEEYAAKHFPQLENNALKGYRKSIFLWSWAPIPFPTGPGKSEDIAIDSDPRTRVDIQEIEVLRQRQDNAFSVHPWEALGWQSY